MPVMDGIEATQKILTLAKNGDLINPEIRVTAITGFVSEVEKAKC